jgi:dTDP-4-dehydrorhamnose reductase
MTAKERTVLVTGAGGQIGQTICCVFKQLNIRVISFTKYDLDISSYTALKEIFMNIDFDMVINCAGYTDVEESEKNPELAYKTNSEAVKFLAELCKQHEKILIHISTNYVFDGRNKESYRENDLPNPLSIYGKTKLAGERYIQEILPKHYILRTSWVFSEFSGHNFFFKVLKSGLEAKSLKVVSDQFGRPTSAYSIANILALICENKVLSDQFGVYHFCGDRPTTWYDFTCAVFQVAKKFGIEDIDITPIKTSDLFGQNEKRPQNGILNLDKISALGITIPAWNEDLERAILPIIDGLNRG